MKQRVGLARGAFDGAEVLLLDERSERSTRSHARTCRTQ
jgi:hypothetical protein